MWSKTTTILCWPTKHFCSTWIILFTFDWTGSEQSRRTCASKQDTNYSANMCSVHSPRHQLQLQHVKQWKVYSLHFCKHVLFESICTEFRCHMPRNTIAHKKTKHNRKVSTWPVHVHVHVFLFELKWIIYRTNKHDMRFVFPLVECAIISKVFRFRFDYLWWEEEKKKGIWHKRTGCSCGHK